MQNLPDLQVGQGLDTDDMEAWIAEVEFVSEKIKKLQSGEISVEELDKSEARRVACKKKEEDNVRRKEQQLQEMKKEGRRGKGEKKDYINFCHFCFLEYEIPTELCFQCKKKTMTQDQRQKQLQVKVQEYKEKKQRKEENKQKWDLSQKTQKMLWKKNSTNYSRWEYFTSSEEEVEVDPIVPKDDPNFMAMEKDMQQRKQRKQEDLKKAEALKLKGNDYFQTGQYDHAVMKYSEALDLVKDVKALWLNRAAAYIKLRKFRKAISDCTRVIEYAECFENGFTVSRESCFKAFLRRGNAYKERKEFQSASHDVNQALQLFPKDKEALQLQKDIEVLIVHQKRVVSMQEAKQSSSGSENFQVSEKDLLQVTKKCSKNEGDYREQIDKFIALDVTDIRSKVILDLLKCMRKQPEQSKVYFYEKKGINKLMGNIEQSMKEEIYEKENITQHLPPLLIQFYLDGSVLFQEHFITKIRGLSIILQKIDSLLKKAEGKQTSSIYDSVEDYFEILDGMVEEEKTRILMQKDQDLIYHIHPCFFTRIVRLYNTEPALVSTFITLCSNLCYGTSLVKQTFESVHQEIIPEIAPLLQLNIVKNKYMGVSSALCNLLSNFLSDASFRQIFVSKKETHMIFKRLAKQLQDVKLQDNPKCSKWVECAIAVFVNICYQAKEETQKLLFDLNIGELLFKEFIDNDSIKPECDSFKLGLNRAMQVVSKLNYTLNAGLLTISNRSILYVTLRFLKNADNSIHENEYSSNVLKLIMQVFLTSDLKGKEIITKDLQESEYYKQLFLLLTHLRQYILSETELIFCNSCNAIGYIIDSSPLRPTFQNGSNPSSFFHQIIPRLITVVRDRVGNFRKNAAILLAKLTKEEKNLQTLRDLHGMEILQSVFNHIMQK